MYLRLNFLLPDEQHAQEVIESLSAAGIQSHSIHAHKRNLEQAFGDETAGHSWQRIDHAERMEAWAWRADLGIFILALVGLGISLWMSSLVFSVIFPIPTGFGR